VIEGAIALGLALLVVVVFAEVRAFAFVNLDDPQYVSENHFVRSGLRWEGIAAAFSMFRAGNWHPVTWISHMLDVELFGLDAGWHHLVNLALHALNAILLFTFLRAATGARWRSAIIAALFAVHPLHVESVAWVSERKDVLSTLFFLLTLLAYLGYVRRPRRSAFVLVASLFAAGLMAKPMLVTLPFVLLLVDVWPLGRWGGTPAPGVTPALPAALVLEKVPLVAISAASSAVAWLAQSDRGADVALSRIPLGARAGNALLSYLGYLGNTAWPFRLASFYPHPSLSGIGLAAWKVAGAALVLGAVTWLAVRERRRRPYVAFGWCWYLGTLVPVIGLVQVGVQSHADRYTYIPLIGVFVALVWAIGETVVRLSARPALVAVPIAIVIAVLAGVARRQVATWRDSETLHRHALAVTDRNWAAWVGLGSVLSERGEPQHALLAYDEAIRVAPWLAVGWNGVGTALGRLGRHDHSIAALEQAVRIQPFYAEAWYNLGVAYGNVGRHDQAARSFRGAVQANPYDARACFNLAIASLAVGDRASALESLERLRRIDPAREQQLRRILGSMRP
jgi:tetratricopeptide (TPR) repeat protein